MQASPTQVFFEGVCSLRLESGIKCKCVLPTGCAWGEEYPTLRFIYLEIIHTWIVRLYSIGWWRCKQNPFSPQSEWLRAPRGGKSVNYYWASLPVWISVLTNEKGRCRKDKFRANPFHRCRRESALINITKGLQRMLWINIVCVCVSL